MSNTHASAPTRFVEFDGEKFAYRRWGATSEAPPLFFVGHFRAGLDHWDPIVTNGLAEDREVILFNGRGIASSSGTPRNTIEDMADDIAGAIGALGLPQVDLVGFSIGGYQAQEVALRHPALVRKLLLLGTGLRGGEAGKEPRVLEVAPRPVPIAEDFLFLFFGRSEAARAAGLAFWDRRHERTDQDPPSSVEVMQAQIEATNAYMAPASGEDPFAHVRAISAPTMVLNGTDDVMIPTINSWRISASARSTPLTGRPSGRQSAGNTSLPS